MLQRALASVFAQEGAGGLFDMEVLVIDDIGLSATRDVMRQFPSAKYIRLPHEVTASGARNAGIKAASGRYTAFLDDDDEYLPHKLKTQIPVLEARPEIGVLYGQIQVFEEGKLTSAAWPAQAPSGHVFEEFLALTDDFIHPDTMLVRRELFDKAGYFEEYAIGMEHYDLSLRLAFYTQWLFIKGPVGNGHFSRQGLWHTSMLDGTTERALPEIIERALALLPQTPETEPVRRRARVSVCLSIADRCWWEGALLVRKHLVSTMRQYPWMAVEPRVVEQFRRVVGTLASGSQHPLRIAEAFWQEIRAAATSGSSPVPRGLWRLRGELVAEVALAMAREGSPRRAALIAVGAMLRHPALSLQPRFVRHFFRLVYGVLGGTA
jgi:hypothetical protein